MDSVFFIEGIYDMKQFISLNKLGVKTFFIMAGVFFAIAYLSLNAGAETKLANKDTSNKTDNKQTIVAKAAPSEADFTKVTGKCVQCHNMQFSSMDKLKEIKWVVPGNPEASKIYNVIGKNKKPNGTYHNLTDTEKATLKDYIKNLK